MSNQIQQNNMQPEHVSEAVQYSALCVCSKRSANVHLTLTGKPNPAQITLSPVTLGLFIFPCL